MTKRILSLFVSVWVGFSLGASTSAAQTAASAAPAAVQTKQSQAAMTPKAALEQLKDGNARFVGGHRLPRDYSAQIAATAAGQYPFAAVVSCMDSRAPVEIVLDQSIGDVFSVRVAGNVIDPDVLGSLEYAAKVTGVRAILVVGHTHCGAVHGAIDDVKLGNLTGLLARIAPAIAQSGPKGSSKDEAYVDRVVEQNVLVSMKEIRDKSPVLSEMLNSGALGLSGAVYSIETGRVKFLAD